LAVGDKLLKRQVDLIEITRKKSVFLFGPRQTGKSTLIATLPDTIPVFNLLDHGKFASLSADPTLMRQQLAGQNYTNGLVVIDEVQKLPELLDEVHLLIESQKLRFLLTGSSARKLRRGGVNLLGGRARQSRLHPLSWSELGSQFDLLKAVNWGLLPSIYFSDESQLDLKHYIGLYLDEEIRSEASVRQLSSFSRFLSVAALSNGQIINFSAIASDCMEKRQTVHEYFEILQDTLFGDELPAWTKSRKRKALETSKFYMFDIGIQRAINDLPQIKEKSKEFGDAFEHLIWHELRTYISYRKPGTNLAYWRSTSNFEVDFVINDDVAIEVKGKRNVGGRDFRGIKALAEENIFKRYIVVSLDEHIRKTDGIEIMPWQEFLRSLWDGAVF